MFAHLIGNKGILLTKEVAPRPTKLRFVGYDTELQQLSDNETATKRTIKRVLLRYVQHYVQQLLPLTTYRLIIQLFVDKCI